MDKNVDALYRLLYTTKYFLMLTSLERKTPFPLLSIPYAN